MPNSKKPLATSISLALLMAQQPVNAQFNPVLELEDLDGSNGFAIYGINEVDGSGFAVDVAGDINGDGIDDLIVGAYGADSNGLSDSGAAYVVFGSENGFTDPFELADLNSLNGFVMYGTSQQEFTGISVSRAGDINADGIDDLIIGAQNGDSNGNNNSGTSYVVFGSNTGLANPLNLSSLDGSNGFQINGVNAYDITGLSVSSTGDINGDGIDDIAIGGIRVDNNNNDDSGSVYVVFGKSTGFTNPFNLSTINSLNGIVINGVAAGDLLGTSVSSAGDINNDGIDDLLVGAFRSSPNGITNTGSSYVIFGSDSGLASPLNLTTLNGSNGFAIHGVNPNDRSGASAQPIGDFNGDGIDDIIIGAYGSSVYGNSLAGSSYILFGSSSGFAHPFELRTINGLNGIVITGSNSGDSSGRALSTAGDMNGDGIKDIIIGAPRYATDGGSYVVFGSDSSLPNPFNLSSVNGKNGFLIKAASIDFFNGRAVGGGGDVNGDGLDDVIIGSFYADPNDVNRAGSSYVVFGDDTIFKDGFE